MTVFGVAMVRDEADIIGPCLWHMAGQVDRLIVADNLSTDDTRPILDRLAHVLPLTVIDDPDPAWDQAAKMTRLVRSAGEQGATWVVPFDADEHWTDPTGGTVAELLTGQPDGVELVEADLFEMIVTGRDNIDERDPHRRIRYRRPQPLKLRDVAVRYRPDVELTNGNHGAHYNRRAPNKSTARLKVRHYRYRNPDQMVRSIRNGYQALTAAQVPAHVGAHFHQLGQLLDQHGEKPVRQRFYTDWYRATGVGLVEDPAPC